MGHNRDLDQVLADVMDAEVQAVADCFMLGPDSVVVTEEPSDDPETCCSEAALREALGLALQQEGLGSWTEPQQQTSLLPDVLPVAGRVSTCCSHPQSATEPSVVVTQACGPEGTIPPTAVDSRPCDGAILELQLSNGVQVSAMSTGGRGPGRDALGGGGEEPPPPGRPAYAQPLSP